MIYQAIHYVRIGRQIYTPGEIIEAAIPAEKKERLIGKGAIREMGAPFYMAPSTPILGAEDDEPETPITGDGDGEPDAPIADDEETDDENDEEENEDEGEAVAGEAPEIDVTDGIVANTSVPTESPKPKPKRRGEKNENQTAQNG